MFHLMSLNAHPENLPGRIFIRPPGTESRKPGEMEWLNADSPSIRRHITAPVDTIEEFVAGHATPLNPVAPARPKMPGIENDVENSPRSRRGRMGPREQKFGLVGNSGRRRAAHKRARPVMPLCLV
jgi:hypothetical protein